MSESEKSSSESMIDDYYKKIFDDEMRFLQRRLENNPNLSADDIAGQLQSLYTVQGQDWEGRGQLGDAEMDATIAAYEAFMSQLKSQGK